jgi:hypothetical protein
LHYGKYSEAFGILEKLHVKEEGEKVFQELHMNHLVYCLVIPLRIGSKVGQLVL